MPNLAVRKVSEVPTPNRASKTARESQELYEGFIRRVGSEVGELELAPDERARGVKVRLRRAAARLGSILDVWDADGRVYFRIQTKGPGRRSRPRKTG